MYIQNSRGSSHGRPSPLLQAEGVIEFPIGAESGVAGDGGAVELQLDLACGPWVFGHRFRDGGRIGNGRQRGIARVLPQMDFQVADLVLQTVQLLGWTVTRFFLSTVVLRQHVPRG